MQDCFPRVWGVVQDYFPRDGGVPLEEIQGYFHCGLMTAPSHFPLGWLADEVYREWVLLRKFEASLCLLDGVETHLLHGTVLAEIELRLVSDPSSVS